MGKKKWLWRGLAALGVVGAAGLALLWIRLPGLVEHRLIRSLHRMGFSEVRLTVRSVGFRHLDLSSVFLGTSSREGVIIASLAIDFRLSHLRKGRIARVAAAGVEFSLDITQNRVMIPGLSPLFTESGGGSAPFLERFDLTGATVLLKHAGDTLPIPFSLHGLRRETETLTSITAWFAPRGERLDLGGRLDLDRGDGTLTLAADRAQAISLVAGLSPPIPQLLELDLAIQGKTELRSWRPRATSLVLRTNALKLAWRETVLSGEAALSLELDERLHPRQVKLGLALAQQSGQTWQMELPLRLDVTGSDGDDLGFHVAPLALRSPLAVRFDRLDGRLVSRNGKREISGAFAATLPLAEVWPSPPGKVASGSLECKASFALLAGPAGLEWQLRGQLGGRSLKASVGENTLVVGQLDNPFHLQGRNRTVEDAGTLTATGVDVRGSALDSRAMRFVLPWRLGGTPERLTVPAAGVLPGMLSFPAIRVFGKPLGSLGGTMVLSPQGLDLAATLHTPVPSLTATIEGTLSWQRAQPACRIGYQIPETRLSHADPVDSLFPFLKGYTLAGTWSGSGELILQEGRWRSPARFRWQEGELKGTGRALALAGIHFALELTDLLELRSARSQPFTFTSLKIGDFALPGGRLAITLENPDSVFLDAGELDYSGGRITVLPFRYPVGASEIPITLYADRLRFDATINQLMGEPTATGDAELNGLLTLRLNDGVPIFQSGHLYSTPGVSGNLQLKRGSLVTGGMVLVEEAMSDFNYEWVRMALQSSGDKLNLTAFIQGAPAKKLALTYDTASKEFIRDPSGKRNVNLKGLLLELRFREIDLRRLLSGRARLP